MNQNIYYYQSIPELGIEGRQKTQDEFEKIGLPKYLSNKSVLDIGCNIGAFLLEANKRGADFLVGIEPLDEWRWLARGISEEKKIEVRFYKDISKFSGEQYDLVLLLSVLHLVEDPQKLLDKAWNLTAEGGLLIVEINDRLQDKKLVFPQSTTESYYGNNKDNRSVYHFIKSNG